MKSLIHVWRDSNESHTAGLLQDRHHGGPYLIGLAPHRAYTLKQMLIQLILSLLLHNVWDIPMVVLTSQVQHFVVNILIMVVINLDVTEVAVENNVTATNVEFLLQNSHLQSAELVC